MRIGHPIRGPIEREIIMSITRKDRKTTIMMKEQVEMEE